MASSEPLSNTEVLLSTDHDSLDQLLTALVAALDKGDAATAFKQLDLFWARLAMHIRAENLHLFSTLVEALERDDPVSTADIPSRSDALAAIEQLRIDHDFFMHELIGAIKLMREGHADENHEADAIQSVQQIIAVLRKRLEAHNKLEEEWVYRWPAALVGPEQQSRLAKQIRIELENLPPRFRDNTQT